MRSSNIRTRDGAIQHYKSVGKKQYRHCTRRPVLLRYSVCQELFNQMYAHMSALILADVLGADIVLPPSVSRKSFEDYGTSTWTRRRIRWSGPPPALGTS